MDSNELNYANSDMWGEIELTLKPNYEFVMEMLKYNQWVKVVGPKSVVDYFKEHLNSIAKLNKSLTGNLVPLQSNFIIYPNPTPGELILETNSYSTWVHLYR